MSEEFMLVEIVEPDGLCHWKMQCEHGLSECRDTAGHRSEHANKIACQNKRNALTFAEALDRELRKINSPTVLMYDSDDPEYNPEACRAR